MAEKKWISDAIERPGALRRKMGVAEGQTIPAQKLDAVITRLRKKAAGDATLSEEDRRTLRQANLAKTLRNRSK